jgi:hypothetical protein
VSGCGQGRAARIHRAAAASEPGGPNAGGAPVTLSEDGTKLVRGSEFVQGEGDWLTLPIEPELLPGISGRQITGLFPRYDVTGEAWS